MSIQKKIVIFKSIIEQYGISGEDIQKMNEYPKKKQLWKWLCSSQDKWQHVCEKSFYFGGNMSVLGKRAAAAASRCLEAGIDG